MSSIEALRPALEAVNRQMSASATLPPAVYTDPELLEAEKTGLLRESWLGVGRADRWPSPGDYTAMELAGTPLIVLRDEERRLRAFANTCRHRGTQLLQGSGSTQRIKCPFHGWTYDLAGRLRGATRMDHAEGFHLADISLVEFRAAERGGFAFVCLNEAAPDIDAWLGAFDEHHAPWALADLVTTRSRELEVGCNWKLFLEVFNESYHLDHVHPKTFGGIYTEPDPADDLGGSLTSGFSPTIGTGGLKRDEQHHVLPMMLGLTGRNREGARYTWVFPNLTFAAGTEALWAYEARPISAARCRVTQWVCFPPETVASPGFEAKAERYYARMDEALAEDIAVLERQQLGMSSPFASQGRWSELERGASAFAAWYAERMRQG